MTEKEEHYVVRVEVVKVTNYFETTAYGTGSRPSGYKKEELEKHRRQTTVANFSTTQADASPTTDSCPQRNTKAAAHRR